MKLLIKGTEMQIGRTYDAIFNIFNKHSTFFKVETEREYVTKGGYMLEIKSFPPEAEMEISQLRNVEIMEV